MPCCRNFFNRFDPILMISSPLLNKPNPSMPNFFTFYRNRY